MTSATNKAIARELRSVAREFVCELRAIRCTTTAVVYYDAGTICNRRASELTAKAKKKGKPK